MREEGTNSSLSVVKGQETEIKVCVASIPPLEEALRQSGFQLKRERVFERNTIFDTVPPALRPNGCLLRLREAEGLFTVTFKGKATVAKHKSREETEFEVSDAEAAFTVFCQLGYRPTFVYEKYRTEYTDGEGVVTLDETPIGSFAELEGPEAWIDETAVGLGFSSDHYITASYGALYLQWCEKTGVAPSHMKFDLSDR